MLLEARDVAGLEVDDTREKRDAAVPRHDVDGRDAVATRETPGDGVLATARTEHKAVEARRPKRASGAALLALLGDDLLHLLTAPQVVPDLLHVTPTRSSPAASTRCRTRRGSPRRSR